MRARALLIAAAAGAALAYAASARSATSSSGVTTEGDEGGSLLDELIAEGAGILSGEPMHISQAGLELLKKLEGFSPTWYADAQTHSIGYGHAGGLESLAFPGEAVPSLTEAQAAGLLEADVRAAERVVSSTIHAPLSQAQYDALVSFAFNVGAGAFRSSTLARKVNAGDNIGAAAEFGRWRFTTDASGDKLESSALKARRAREAQLFAQNDYGSLSA